MFVFSNTLLFSSHDNKRRTKHILKSLNPVWNCTVTYPNVYREEVKNKTLEFTVWDWDRFKSNDFLGMVLIDLSGKHLVIITHFLFTTRL